MPTSLRLIKESKLSERVGNSQRNERIFRFEGFEPPNWVSSPNANYIEVLKIRLNTLKIALGSFRTLRIKRRYDIIKEKI